MSVCRMTAEAFNAMQARNRTAWHEHQPTPLTDRIRLVLPWPPTVNHSTTPGRHGGKVLTADHRAFRRSVSTIAVAAGSPTFHAADRLHVSIDLVPPDKRHFDIDNRIKACLDALQLANVIPNDSQVDALVVHRQGVIIPGEGSAVVTIERIAA